ncbi:MULTISPECIES: PadR family transcriptional regulator [Carnobacterium]|uniref:Transcriptional regulator PadR-like family protein n=1 Tax=Carnobacterium maltaromaticum LMA28 TaxID=1234679 RepID=K8E353_CARML|nr:MULTISPECIES: PadR family transcriptional regulator [Carnobacterium]AOA01509.1 PadR family transcriptional regulator [Carnobacterium maltaromaticum]MBC9808548.1 PadR family transcriptional regulator [Carnobacterium maltaromaticum]MBQ6484268.1 PadR family transcriptional regulator [Carnobacterium sp.]MCI1820336.1 PadR family transcriptional regulator [Carnobacterium maltaromaticum]MDT1946018.1 PadR family transcriptional regulator [Carnobacterium maltaromaticum]
MNTQFKKGVLELCVLVILEKKDCYGYELIETISKHIEISEGTIYPLLRKLTKEGLCTTYLQESNEGPSRKYYQVTEDGVAYLGKQLIEWKEFIKSVDTIIEIGDE